jgi:hypothetical protein
MSQKNETTVLVLSLLITAALLGAGFWWLFKNPIPPWSLKPPNTVANQPVQERFSAGEKVLIPSQGYKFVSVQKPRLALKKLFFFIISKNLISLNKFFKKSYK